MTSSDETTRRRALPGAELPGAAWVIGGALLAAAGALLWRRVRRGAAEKETYPPGFDYETDRGYGGMAVSPQPLDARNPRTRLRRGKVPAARHTQPDGRQH